jgi:hypothetical protein
MKYLLLVLAGVISTTACSSDNTVSSTSAKDVLMRNDFESLVGWIPDPVALTKDQAHSGQYSLKVDQAHEYSSGYSYLLGLLSPTRIRGVRAEAWAYAPEHDCKAQLRVALNDAVGGNPIMVESIEYSSQVKSAGKWVKVSKDIIFPPTANYSSQLVVYLWRGDDHSKAYVDDVQLTALR